MAFTPPEETSPDTSACSDGRRPGRLHWTSRLRDARWNQLLPIAQPSRCRTAACGRGLPDRWFDGRRLALTWRGRVRQPPRYRWRRNGARAVVDAAGDADVVIGAGDFATCSVHASDTLDVLRALRCPLILVHGNHDDPHDLHRLTEDWSSAHLLHGKAIAIDGVTFFGLGGEVPVRSDTPWNANETAAAAAALLADCPSRAILIAHTPLLLRRSSTAH